MSKRKPGDRLTETFIKGIKQPGTHGDGRGGNGLKIVVKLRSNGELRKSWIQRIRIGDKKPDIGLGTFPVVTLLSARDMATNNRRRVDRGEDIRSAPPTIPTLKDGFEAVIKEREDGWDNEETKAGWYRALRRCKKIASKPVSEIKPTDVLSVIKPLWHAHPKAARDLRSNLSTVMEWAITNEFRLSNPARPGITKGLGQQPDAVSRPSLAPEKLGRALATIRDSDFWWAEKYCTLFLAFTCVRSREAREATWAEINFSTRTWTIPASHMKKRKAHQVPAFRRGNDDLDLRPRAERHQQREPNFSLCAQRQVHGRTTALHHYRKASPLVRAAWAQVELHKLGGGTNAYPGSCSGDGPSTRPEQSGYKNISDCRLLPAPATGYAGVGRFFDQDHGPGHIGDARR